MINSSKAIAANTDLASAQAFLFRSAGHNIALIISAEAEDVFLRIKAAVNETESVIQDEADSIPSKLAKIHQSLATLLIGVNALQVMIVAWSEDILYIQARGHYYAVLYRQNDIINLVTPAQEDQLISGHITPGDRVLFGTQSLVRILGEIQSRNPELEFLLKNPPQNFQDEIDNLVANKTELEPIAAIMLNMEAEAPVAAQPAPTTAQPASTRHRVAMPKFHFRPPSLGFRRLIRRVPVLGDFRIYAAALILVFLIGSGYLGFNFIKNRTQSSQVGPLVSQAQTKYNTAVSLKDLNTEEAKTNLSEADRLVNEALKLNPNDPTAKQLKAQIDQNKGEILRQLDIADWPVFLSLDLIKSGFQATNMTAYGDYLLLLDPTAKTLVLLDKTQKSNQILAGDRQLGSASFASINSDLAFAYSPDKGVVRIDTQNQDDSQIIKPDSEWGKISDIVGFGSNVYLLDSGKSQIWKYVPAASGYSDKTPYLKGEAQLQDASRMLIDSSVWVLRNNEILRFTSGAEDFFSISGLDQPIKSISTFFVSDETESLYLIDPENQRLLAFDKTGKYQAQYVGEKFATATDLAVDEELKKVYILEGNKIYQLDLK